MSTSPNDPTETTTAPSLVPIPKAASKQKTARFRPKKGGNRPRPAAAASKATARKKPLAAAAVQKPAPQDAPQSIIVDPNPEKSVVNDDADVVDQSAAEASNTATPITTTTATTEIKKNNDDNQVATPEVASTTKSKATKPAAAVTVQKRKASKISTGIRSGAARKSASSIITPSIRAGSSLSTTVTSGDKIVACSTSASSKKKNSNIVVPVPVGSPANRGGALLIPPAQPGEKSMSEFCTKFKDPNAPKKVRRSKRRKSKDAEKDKEENDNGGGEEESSAQNKKAEEEKKQKQKSKPKAPKQVEASAGPVVELVNGEIVIRESSLMVGHSSTTVDEEYEEVHEGSGEMSTTYSSFLHKNKARKWSAQDTKLFYESLRQCGPDFSTMESFFPDRNRRQLKNKYKRETRSNPYLIRMALTPCVQKPIG